jgi:DNA-directed RNA polymerase subunit F
MDNIIRTKKKNKNQKQKQKINNNIVNVTKLPKITTKINLNNKYIRQDKELLEILKLIFEKKKRKKRNNDKINSKNKSSAISGINAGVASPKIEIEERKPNFIPVLGNSHNVNTYRMLENEIMQLKNNLNNKRLENGSISLNEAKNNLLENKKEHAINWTHTEPEAFELVRKVAKHRDPQAAKKLVENIPEFKGMMEDLAELGASSAKDHIKALNKDIDILEENRNKLDEHNNKLNDEIDELNFKIKQIENNKDLLESQTY